MGELLVLSNRLPDLDSDESKSGASGLVSAILPVMRARTGTWLGWNGESCHEDEPTFRRSEREELDLVSCPLTDAAIEGYYNRLCNRTLWPVLHGFKWGATCDEKDWQAYRDVNRRFARALMDVAQEDSILWVHDYHFFLVAEELRALGYRGRVGFFLHVPFPSPDVLETMPFAEELVSAMLSYDLVGFHTRAYARRFQDASVELAGARRAGPGHLLSPHGHTYCGAFPLGIEPKDFAPTEDVEAPEEIAKLRRSLLGRKLILGLDRLDYTKGVPERLLGFERMLQTRPDLRGRASFLQVSVPSRIEVPEYADLRTRVETIVGRINGEHGTADWVPVRYLFRGFAREELAALYREADVACVTPLCDGMNLVAKEYVASQRWDRPGVLVLSKFAGAAHEMRDALLINPFYADGFALALATALEMPLEERRTRHAALRAGLDRTTSRAWADRFVATLEGIPIKRSVGDRNAATEAAAS